MSLEQDLNLKINSIDLTPVDIAYIKPSYSTLKRVPKTQQTIELLNYVISNDGNALQSASKKLISYELCLIAVKENGLALRYVPNDYITKELCDVAVCENGLAIKFVPKRFISSPLLLQAVTFYYARRDHHTRQNPYLNIDITKAKKEAPILGDYTKYPIYYAPEHLVTQKLIKKSLLYAAHSIRDIPSQFITKDIILIAASIDGTIIKYLPKNRISKEIINTAVSSNPFSLEHIPPHKKTKEVCLKCFDAEPLVIKNIPLEYINTDLCLDAVNRNPFSFGCIPQDLITLEMCLCAIRKGYFKEKYSYSNIPVKFINNPIILESIIQNTANGAESLLTWNSSFLLEHDTTSTTNLIAQPLNKSSVKYLQSKNSIPLKKLAKSLVESTEECVTSDKKTLKDTLSFNDITIVDRNKSVVHTFDNEESSDTPIYYISDIHLEHQLKPIIKDLIKNSAFYSAQHYFPLLEKINEFLDKKINEMISPDINRNGILLVGGDVSNSKELWTLFYKKLAEYWDGEIISILGNHELWDGDSSSILNHHAKSCSEVIDDYRATYTNFTNQSTFKFLENQVFVNYKNSVHTRVLDEELILKTSTEELTHFFKKCSIIILGGIGFSGLNPVYNALSGLYRSTIVSLEEDKSFSKRFFIIYQKVKSCAKDKKVIVFTHTPIENWSSDSICKNWIYVNGHTHQNKLVIDKDGTTILADNQIGYLPKKWKLNAILMSTWYDPFVDYSDGIYPITSQEYTNFNVGRRIGNIRCNFPGQIYMIKKNKLYMFLLKSEKSLCLLVGGQRRRLKTQNINYYYENIERYAQIILDAIKPYQQYLQSISNDIKSFGGTGIIHGCIVDISFYSHLYVNPFDGKVVPYWAIDTFSRLAFNKIEALIKNKEPELYSQFLVQLSNEGLTTINNKDSSKLTTVPKWVLGNDIYIPSKIFKSLQYIWHKNVIRAWNDDILDLHSSNIKSSVDLIT